MKKQPIELSKVIDVVKKQRDNMKEVAELEALNELYADVLNAEPYEIIQFVSFKNVIGINHLTVDENNKIMVATKIHTNKSLSDFYDEFNKDIRVDWERSNNYYAIEVGI